MKHLYFFTLILLACMGLSCQKECPEDPDLCPGIDASFSASPKIGPVPLEVHFSVRAHSPDDKFYWDFGDGNSSNEKSPTHTFTEPGKYQVKFKLTDRFGQTAEQMEIITVEKELVPDFSWTINRGYKGIAYCPWWI